MSYHLENPSASNVYFTNAGSAISDTTQPRITSNVMAGVDDDSIPAEDYGLISTSPYEVYTGHDNNEIIRSYTNSFKSGSVSDDAIKLNGSDLGRHSIHRMRASRVNKVATAIRAGLWHEYSGVFTSAPGTADNISDYGTDEEAVVNGRSDTGEFTFNFHGSGYRRDYNPKTQ